MEAQFSFLMYFHDSPGILIPCKSLFDYVDETQFQLCFLIATLWLYLEERNPAKSFLNNQLI